MAKGISIGIASDTREFATGVSKGVIKPLEDAADALDDVAKEGDKAGDRLESAFKGAQGEVSDFKKDQSALAREMSKQSKKGAGDVADNNKKGFSEAGDAAENFKQEAANTARETAASFDGSAESIGDAFQEVAANAFVGFGPAGVAAGLAGAAGLGVVLSALTQQQEAADELKAKMADMYRAAVEEGRAYIDEAAIVREMQDIMWNPERVTEYNNLVKDSKDLGLDLTTVLAANAGDREKVTEVQGRINALLDDEKSKVKELGALELAQGQIASDFYDIDVVNADKKYRGIADAIDGNIEKAKTALSIEKDYAKEQMAGIQRTRDASQARWEAQAAAIDKAKGKLTDIPTEIKVKIVPDDSAIRNWRAPMLDPATVSFRPGKRVP